MKRKKNKSSTNKSNVYSVFILPILFIYPFFCGKALTKATSLSVVQPYGVQNIYFFQVAASLNVA